MSEIVVGIDIGGSGTKACLVAGERIVGQVFLPTDLAAQPSLGAFTLSALDRALAEVGRGLDEVSAIGVGVPGQVDGGWVRHAANLGIDGFGFDLGGHVSSATQVPAFVENDMRVAAFGAHLRSAAQGRGVHNLVYVGIGTGVSAGVVLGGSIHRGSRGLAGEFGHVPMGTGIRCACGSIGCLETVIGAAALRNAWNGGPIASLFEAAEQGDPRAIETAEGAIDHLARAMWWLAAAYDPDLFYIGGGVGTGTPFVRDRVAARWDELAADSDLARRVLDPDRIRMYDLEEPVGAYGAALLAAAHRDRPGKRYETATWEEETIP